MDNGLHSEFGPVAFVVGLVFTFAGMVFLSWPILIHWAEIIGTYWGLSE